MSNGNIDLDEFELYIMTWFVQRRIFNHAHVIELLEKMIRKLRRESDEVAS